MARVILFAREPVPGRVKTRLAAAIGPERAADLYRAFVADAVAAYAAHPNVRVTVAHDPLIPDTPFLTGLCARHGVELLAQYGADLGARMANALFDRLDDGPAVLMGTDLPTLPARHVDEALRLLQRHALVLNPASDGGYYLVGAAPSALPRRREITERLFSGIAWSTGAVLRDTLANRGDLDVALGPPWHDVDEPADLALLRHHLERPGSAALPHTRAVLEQWGAP